MTTTETKTEQTFPLPTLTAMVVGSMVGAGVFSLPRRFAGETGVAGALIAWAIARRASKWSPSSAPSSAAAGAAATA